MIYGSKKLKDIDLSTSETTSALTSAQGRSKDLLIRRNQKLIHRYYYYNGLKNKPYKDTVALLHFEFDIALYTIATVLKNHRDDVIALKKEKPSIRILKAKFPLYSW